MIQGKVTDKQTGEGLVGATIRVENTTLGTVTDAEGYFIIRFLDPSEYTLNVSYVGYRNAIVRQVVVLAGSRHDVSIVMEVGSVEFAPVEIIAPRPLIQKDLGTTTFSITSERIGDLPISTVQEILALQPGTTAEGNVRGGKATATVFAIDGLSTSDLVAGGPALTVPKSAIAGMTIHTGGVDAEFGNAQSGIVNVRTRSGTNQKEWSARLERDSWIPGMMGKQHANLAEGEVSISGPIIADRLHYLFSAAFHVEDSRYWQDFLGFFDSPVISEGSAVLKLDLASTTEHRTSLQVVGTRRRWHDYEFSWRYNLSGLPPRGKDAIRGVVTHYWTPIPAMLVTFAGSAFYQRAKIGTGLKGDVGFHPYEYDFFLRYIIGGNRDWWANTRQWQWSGKGDISWDIGGGHLFKAGAELTQYDLASDVIRTEPQRTYFGKPLPFAEPLNDSYAYTYEPRSASAFVQDKVQVPGLGSILTVGVRWDVLDPTARRPIVAFTNTGSNTFTQQVTGYVPAGVKQQLSPRLSYTAPAGENGYIFVNYGHYIQFPLFDYLYGGLHPEQIRSGTKNIQAANPDLSPERTIAWELGFKHAVTENTLMSITYFRKKMLDQIDAKTLIPFDSKSAGDYGFASYVNNAEASSEGFEFLVARESGHNITGSLSYSYMITEGVSETSNENIALAQWGFAPASRPYPLSWDQRHTVKGDARLRLLNAIDADIVATFHTARPYTFFPTRDGVVPLDSSKAFIPNNARMESVLLFNAKFVYAFETPFTRTARVYIDMRNVMNARNVKWVDSNGRVGGELGDPGGYYEPRTIRIGLEAVW